MQIHGVPFPQLYSSFCITCSPSLLGPANSNYFILPRFSFLCLQLNYSLVFCLDSHSLCCCLESDSRSKARAVTHSSPSLFSFSQGSQPLTTYCPIAPNNMSYFNIIIMGTCQIYVWDNGYFYLLLQTSSENVSMISNSKSCFFIFLPLF